MNLKLKLKKNKNYATFFNNVLQNELASFILHQLLMCAIPLLSINMEKQHFDQHSSL